MCINPVDYDFREYEFESCHIMECIPPRLISLVTLSVHAPNEYTHMSAGCDLETVCYILLCVKPV